MNLVDSIQLIVNRIILGFISLTGIVIIFDIIFSIIRDNLMKKEAYKVTFFQIKLPPDNEFEVKAAEHMFSSLYGFRKPFLKALFTGQYSISFEIVSKSGE